MLSAPWIRVKKKRRTELSIMPSPAVMSALRLSLPGVAVVDEQHRVVGVVPDRVVVVWRVHVA